MSDDRFVWVFTGKPRPLPSGVFNDLKAAEEWIGGHGLTGTLIEYPVGYGAYDWAVARGRTEPVNEEAKTAAFLQSFVTPTGRRFDYDNDARFTGERRSPTHFEETGFVWVFNGAEVGHPCGVFKDRASADEWIRKNNLVGLLTEYPTGVGAYDWTVANGYFKPKKDHHFDARHIQQFSSGYTQHFHYDEDRGCL